MALEHLLVPRVRVSLFDLRARRVDLASYRARGQRTCGNQKRAESFHRYEAQKRWIRTTSKNSPTYAWVNKDKGIVQIPIDRAMQLVAMELATKKVGPSAREIGQEHYKYGLQDLSFAPAASGSAAPAASGTAPAPATSGSRSRYIG